MTMAIQFAVRDSAGALQRGTVAGEGEGSFIQIGAGDSLSLNLSPANVAAYAQEGNDLLVKLVDGRVVTLAGFFHSAGGARGLYLSEKDEITEVFLTNDGSGYLLPGYLPVQPTEKWSPLDGLRFSETDTTAESLEASEDDSSLLLYGAGLLAGLGVVNHFFDGDSNGTGRVSVAFDPAPIAGDNIVNANEAANGVTITGTSSPGSAVSVEWGPKTLPALSSPDGNWTVTFTPTDIPIGTYPSTAIVTARDKAGNVASDRRDIAVDTEIAVDIDDDQVVGTTVSGAERDAGFTLTGTGDAGTNLSVSFGTPNGVVTRTAIVDANGTWSVDYEPGEIPRGTYEAALSVTATDAAGNTATDTQTIMVDTEIAVDIDDDQVVGTTVSGAERDAGFTLTGTGDAGTNLSVSFGTPNGVVTRTAIVDANGTWSVDYEPGEIPRGTYEAAISVTATDAAGNTATDTQTIAVDTEIAVTIDPQQAGDNTISGAERLAGITLTGTADAGALLAVTFNSITYENVLASNTGLWSVPVSTAGIPSGTTIAAVSVSARDSIGNVATANHVVKIDTEVVPLTRDTLSTGADDVLNDVEASRGLTITGTVEAGSTVEVSFDGNPARAATVSGSTWSLTLPASELPSGTTTADLVVSATDQLGNVGQLTETVAIDREVTPLRPGQAQLAGDGYLNAEEAAAGLTVTGVTEPNATVEIQAEINGQPVGTPTRITADQAGNWSGTLSTPNLPRGELDATVKVQVTDIAGNVAQYSQPLIIDTLTPSAPVVIGFSRTSGGLTGVVTETAEVNYEFAQVDVNGNIAPISAIRTIDQLTQDTNITFGTRGDSGFTSTPVPDGSYLVVVSTDVAGNEGSTMFVVNNTNAPVIDLSRPGLSEFDFSAIDLTFAPNADLQITEAQITAITGADKTLLIRGGIDDTVNIIGGAKTDRTQDVDEETYNIFTVGSSGATILLDEDIQMV